MSNFETPSTERDYAQARPKREIPFLYTVDIEEAKRQGHILENPDRMTYFSHDKKLSYTNTRFLRPEAKAILSLFQGAKSVLELGPGSGAAAAQMSHLFPNLEVMTIGGTSPIDPYLRFSRQVLELAQTSHNPTAVGGIRKLLETYEIDYYTEVLSIDDSEINKLLQLQREKGIPIFDVLDYESPFIRQQIVDNFPSREYNFGDQQFDFIYERQGPIFHTANSFPDRVGELLQAAQKLLSPQGIMLLDSIVGNEEGFDDVAIFRKANFGSLLVKKENPFLEDLENLVHEFK